MMIKEVEIKKLIVHRDKRGFFCELIKKSDKFFKNCHFAQLSHSFVRQGVIKAWHMHKKQTDFIYVAAGEIKLVLFDLRKKSASYKQLMELVLGKKDNYWVVKIPPGIAHGYKSLKGPAQVIYLMNKEYDPSDEIRIAYNDPEIGYNWNK
jgi:dTDP-4-dehydrorhamnose 3,5-epimerase